MRRILRDEALRAALPAWVLARLFVALGYAVALVAADELLAGGRPFQLRQGLFAWDAAFYRDIADVGYDGIAPEALRFFPLLPLLARALAVPLLGNVGVALLVLVQAAALGAGILLFRLVLKETDDRAVATRSAWLLALLPPATVLVLGYAEALLLLFSIGFFLCIRTDRWWLAALLGVAAGLSRPMGMTLALPALLEAARPLAWRQAAPWRWWAPAKLIAIAGPFLGGGLYLLWVEREHGDWRLPMELQNAADLRGGWANPLSTVWEAVSGLANGEQLGEGLHVPWIAVFGVLLVVAFRKLPVSYGAWSAVLLLFALTGNTLGSFERYGLAAFPLLIALAMVARRPEHDRLLLLGCSGALTGFAALVFVGAFVP